MNLWKTIDSRGKRETFNKLMIERADRSTSLYSKSHSFGNLLQGILVEFPVAPTIMEMVQHLSTVIIFYLSNDLVSIRVLTRFYNF